MVTVIVAVPSPRSLPYPFPSVLFTVGVPHLLTPAAALAAQYYIPSTCP